MTSAAVPFLYVDTDVPVGLTLAEFRRSGTAPEVDQGRVRALRHATRSSSRVRRWRPRPDR